jgi:pimeloyl-ACP methyl ester carboxylesterase
MPRSARVLWVLLPLLGGCSSLPRHVESRLPPHAASGVVFVAGGAGGRQESAVALADAADAAKVSLHVCSFDWSSGRGLVDVTDAGHARRQGQVLAAEVRRRLAAHPGVRVSLVGHSAGCAVVLAAAECLPPDSLDRIILLAPAVSPCYDLRRALASARRGADVFTSGRDWLYLGVGTSVVGTPDGGRGPAAGRHGFCPPALGPGEQMLAGRLRQHPWTPCVRWTGNRGGHTGSLQPAFVRTYVLSLLAPTMGTTFARPITAQSSVRREGGS